jgi:streptogramin lyase
MFVGRTTGATSAAFCTLLAASSLSLAAAPVRRPIAELKPTATLHLGRTADWVAIDAGAVWVGSTGPDAVSEIDPRTNRVIATVALPGNPCAGLAVGFGSVWAPVCGHPNALVRIDERTLRVTLVPGVQPAGREGGITTSPDSVWLAIGRRASRLARIDPLSGRIRQTVHVPAGSFNPLYSDGLIWLTHASGAEVTVVHADSGQVRTQVPSGPRPRFLTAGAGAVWTLNQGDGTVTRIDTRTLQRSEPIALGTAGPGGDIAFGAGMVWSSFDQVPLSIVDAASGKLWCQWAGPGGDALGIGHGAVWLTDYHAGTISRIEVSEALQRCRGALPVS